MTQERPNFTIEATERKLSGVGVINYQPFAKGETPEQMFADAQERAERILSHRLAQGQSDHFIEFTLPTQKEQIDSNDR